MTPTTSRCGTRARRRRRRLGADGVGCRRRAAARATRTSTGTARTARRGRRRSRRAELPWCYVHPNCTADGVSKRGSFGEPFVDCVASEGVAPAAHPPPPPAAAAAAVAAAAAAHLAHDARAAAAADARPLARALRAGGRADELVAAAGANPAARPSSRFSPRRPRLPDRRAAAVEPRALSPRQVSGAVAQLGLLAAADRRARRPRHQCARRAVRAPAPPRRSRARATFASPRDATAGYCARCRWRRLKASGGARRSKFALEPVNK